MRRGTARETSADVDVALDLEFVQAGSAEVVPSKLDEAKFWYGRRHVSQHTAGTDQQAFDALLHEWGGVGEGIGRQVTAWQRQFEALERHEADLRERGRWVHGRDDFFGVLKIHRKELHHSSMIAWLLDPCAPHGLGAGFLAEFLAVAFPQEVFDGLASALVDCEVTRAECRADIVVRAKSVALIIENKVDSLESDLQCATLFRHFNEPCAKFVFLTPTGADAETAGDAQDQFRALSYAEVRGALDRALRATGEHPVESPGRRLAADYLRTLIRDFK